MVRRTRSRAIGAKLALAVAAGALASGLTGALVASPAGADTFTVVCLPGQPNNLKTTLAIATSGSTINVLGTCTGNFTIPTSLTLKGPAILDGNNSGTVVTVDSGVTATLSSLIIQHGSAPSGGGVVNNGTLTLNSSLVSKNATTRFGGGGIDNGLDTAGTVNLNSSLVSNNTAFFGGGILNDQGSTLNVDSSSVSKNTAESGGGIDNEALAAVHMVSSIVSANVATGGPGSGGGIANFGPVTLVASSVLGNHPDNCVGPVSVPGCVG